MPLVKQKSFNLLIASTQAAVLRSRFLAEATSRTQEVAVDITSYSPPQTISFYLAPSRRFLLAQVNLEGQIPVAFSMTSMKLRLDFSSHFLNSLPHLTCSRFLSHSKQDTVTPPPLHRTSGRKLTPFLRRISYPLRVVGPLAASTMSLHWNLSALLMLIDCSNAAGMKISLD